MSNPLRILTVIARPFYPADTGGRTRSSKLLERLARMHRVTILCFRTSDDTAEQLEQMHACCERLETIEWTETAKFTPSFYAELGAAALSPLPFTVRKYRSAAMRQRVRELLSTGAFDLLLCDFLQPSINCFDEPFSPKVLFQHNVEAVIRTRHAEHASNPFARAFLRHEARKLKAFERQASSRFDHCIMVSDEDCRTMAAEYGVTHTSAIPTGVDVEYFAPRDIETPDPEVVFVGSMDWLPNQDAVAFFVAEILPRIRRETPARFTVVGRNPPDAIRRLDNGTTIRVTGTVPDVRPMLARAHVVVVPIQVGGGTRIKIFEAMAMGKAVVSTSVGAEGLPVTHGRDILIADDPSAFAAHVVELLKNKSARLRLGTDARRLVCDGYSWDAAALRFSDICRTVVGATRSRGGS